MMEHKKKKTKSGVVVVFVLVLLGANVTAANRSSKRELYLILSLMVLSL